MRFSIVMPSYLGDYPKAAANRDTKLLRAVNSVVKQLFEDWELIIVADGCEKTVRLVKDITDQRVRLIQIPKQKMWSGEVRNAGIRHAKGDYVCYLDIDDMLGVDHLEVISNQLDSYDWVYFNDLVYNKKKDHFDSRITFPGRIGKCGTSNICHKREMGEIWIARGYGHEDLQASRMLMKKSSNYKLIETPTYFVCHIPKKYDL